MVTAGACTVAGRALLSSLSRLSASGTPLLGAPALRRTRSHPDASAQSDQSSAGNQLWMDMIASSSGRSGDSA